MGTDRITGGPRPRGRCIAAAVGVLLLTASVAACGGGGDAGQSGAIRLPSPSRPGSSRAGQSSANRRADRCHLVSEHALADGVDRSKPVPCSQRHNLETIGPHPVYGKVDAAVLRQYRADCGNDVTNTLHIQGLRVVRVDVSPIEARTAGGRTVIRCDASLVSGVGEYHSLPHQVTSTSLRKVTDNGKGAVVRWCTNTPSGPDGSTFVDCRRPHLAEVTGPWAAITVTGGYPARGQPEGPGHLPSTSRPASRLQPPPGVRMVVEQGDLGGAGTPTPGRRGLLGLPP